VWLTPVRAHKYHHQMARPITRSARANGGAPLAMTAYSVLALCSSRFSVR
jgi:hypothetical protein